MDDTSSGRAVDLVSVREKACAVARLLDDHKGEDTVLLDLSGVSTLADYFVITTARSAAHLSGLLKELSRHLPESGLRPMGRHKGIKDKGWLLVDCGDIVIHLMEREQREFYELERLWFRAEKVPYSSKSS
jgi:ribosome-associated protein